MVSARITRSMVSLLRAITLILFWAVMASVLAEHGSRFFGNFFLGNTTESDIDVDIAAIRRDQMDMPRMPTKPKANTVAPTTLPAVNRSNVSEVRGVEFELPFDKKPPVVISSDTGEVDDVMSKGVQRLPDCLVIGVRKGGTRALTTFLALHPNIATVKREVEFFNDDNNYNKGLDWYRKQMPMSHPTKQVLIEKSAEYFHKSFVPERVYKMKKDIKLILVVRDPFVRLVSDYNFIRRYAAMTASSYPFIELRHSLEDLLIDNRTGKLIYDHKEFGGLHRSQYAKFFKNWLDWFPKENIHIVDGDRLAQENPAFELSKVETFINVKHYLTEDMFVFDEQKGFYCTKATGCLGKEKGHKLPNFDPDFVRKVKMFFKKFNDQFYELAGRTFDWDRV